VTIEYLVGSSSKIHWLLSSWYRWVLSDRLQTSEMQVSGNSVNAESSSWWGVCTQYNILW